MRFSNPVSQVRSLHEIADSYAALRQRSTKRGDMPVYKVLRAKVGFTRMSHADFLGFLWRIYVSNVHNPHFSVAPISFPDFLVRLVEPIEPAD